MNKIETSGYIQEVGTTSATTTATITTYPTSVVSNIKYYMFITDPETGESKQVEVTDVVMPQPRPIDFHQYKYPASPCDKCSIPRNGGFCNCTLGLMAGDTTFSMPLIVSGEPNADMRTYYGNGRVNS